MAAANKSNSSNAQSSNGQGNANANANGNGNANANGNGNGNGKANAQSPNGLGNGKALDQADKDLVGSSGNDQLIGGGGDDKLVGGPGNDKLVGGPGKDKLIGDSGNDVLFGGPGDDWLHGGPGNDVLFGGKGDDWLQGGSGNDVVKGGDGDDVAVFVASENVGSRNNVYEGNRGWDTFNLVLTEEEAANPLIQKDIADYRAFLADHSNPNAVGGPVFHFRSLNLHLKSFEDFIVTINPTGGDQENPHPTESVKTYSLHDQLLPAVVSLSNGDVVMVWSSLNRDGSSWGVYGQRFNQDGTPIGDEFQVNTTTADSQIDPSIASLADGGFVVTWSSFGQDGNGFGVYGQRYDANGNAVGGEFQVNTTATGDQHVSVVASLADGGFIVSWDSSDGSQTDVFAQRFDAAGNPVGEEFRVNATTAGNQDHSDIAGLADGGFVVVWRANVNDGGLTQDGWGASVQMQRYDAAGNPVGGESQVNTYTLFEQVNPSVAALSSGGFVVVWQSVNQDGDSWGVYGQMFDATGERVDSEFQINTTIFGQQIEPDVAALADGGFVVTWTSDDAETGSSGIYAQRFNAAGEMIDSERKINDVTNNNEINSQVIGLVDGGFAVAYDSYAADGGGYGIVLRFVYNNGFYGTAGNDTLYGSNLDDVIFGGDGDDTLIGLGGNDVLYLGTDDNAVDTVVLTQGGGHDRVFDFEIGYDRLDVADFGFTDFSEIEPLISMNGADTLVSLPGGVTVTLVGIDEDDISSGHFLL